MSKQRKPRFTLLTVLLLTAWVATAISHFRTSVELSDVRSELTELRNDLIVLDADDDSQAYAIALPTYGPLQWRWKIQLPQKGSYRLKYAFDQIPASGFPSQSQGMDGAFLDAYAKPLRGGVPFTLDIGIFQDANGVWQFQSNNGSRGTRIPIRNEPVWLADKSSVGWGSMVFGSDQTVSADGDSPLMLLRRRKSKQLPGGAVTYDTNPTDGLLIWVEPVLK